MKNILIQLFLAVTIGIFISSCSDLETDISEPQNIGIHKTGILDLHSENFHGKLIRDNNWNLKECANCHSEDFSGGVTNSSCRSCHTAPEGPKSCNTCHGDFNDPSRSAPGKSIDDSTSTTYKGVGAHIKHLYENSVGSNTPCGSCHSVPNSIYDVGHMDNNLPAEVVMKDQSVLFGAVNAAYNPSDATCSNTYCHGNFEFLKDSALSTNQFAYTADKMTGLNKTVAWTKVNQGEAECGSCHGLPPEGHINVPLSSCYSCHEGVVDENGNIIDKSKHINGVKNSRGN